MKERGPCEDGLRLLSTWYGVPSVELHARRLTNGLSSTDMRTVGTFIMKNLAARGGGTFFDPGEPANLSLDDLAAMEPTTFCDE
jgi:hypothetical protein